MLTDTTPTTALLDAARSLRFEVANRVEEIERERKLPADLIDVLSEAAIFRMLIPREFGGLEVDLDVAIEVTAEISRADASTGWQVLVGSSNQYFLGILPESTMRTAMSVPGGALVRGALAPKGVAQPVEGGYRLTGCWPLASGSYEAHWVPAGFLVMDENDPRRLPNGARDIRVAVLRPEDVRWYDTWDAVGLRGSQSQDFEVSDLFVPEEWTGSFFGGSSINSPWFSLPPMPTGPLHAAVIVGALRGLIDDLSALAPTKKPAFGGGATLADDSIFTTKFGELASQVDILDVANHHVAATFMEIGRSGDAPDRYEYQRLQAMNARIQRSATGIADEFIALAGSTAVYSSNSMQRRWRDIRTAAIHINAGLGSYTHLGTTLSGGQPHATTATGVG